jgi:hypothetical protein
MPIQHWHMLLHALRLAIQLLCCCCRSRTKPQRQRLVSCVGWSSLFWALLLTVVLVVQAAWQAADYQRFPAEAYGQLVDVHIDNTDCEQQLGAARHIAAFNTVGQQLRAQACSIGQITVAAASLMWQNCNAQIAD